MNYKPMLQYSIQLQQLFNVISNNKIKKEMR